MATMLFLTESDNIRQRRETFIGWNGRKTPVQLAIAGFRYTGTSDKVVCPTCNLQLNNWVESQDAVQAHRTHSPDCAFIKKWFNGPAKTLSSDSAADQCDASSGTPKYPEFKDYQRRLDSYTGWPLKDERQSPRCMATEGFFYIGSADRARCFDCGVTFRDWENDDVPLDVHITYSPGCGFAKERARQQSQQNSSSSVSKVQSNLDTLKTVQELCNGTGNEEELCIQNTGARGGETSGSHDNTHNSTRYSPMIEAVLEFGFSIEDIMKAIQDEKHRSGKEFTDAQALVIALTE